MNDGIKKKLVDLTMCISFKLRGAPKFTVYIKPEGVHLDEGEVENPDVSIEGDLPLSFLIIDETVSVYDLVKAWLTGKFKIRRGISHIFKMRKAFKLFQTSLKHKFESMRRSE